MCRPDHYLRPGAWRAGLVSLLAAVLAACATTEPATEPVTGPPPSEAAPVEPASFTLPEFRVDPVLAQTATQPLTDLNLQRTEIPVVLLEAQRAPYTPPAGESCMTLISELQALDAALGPDIDLASEPAEEPDLLQKATTAVGDAAYDSVRGAVSSVVDGVLPLRSWVRRLSGAERHAGTVSSAIRAGTLRRAYLKGWGQAAGCALPPPPARDAAAPAG